MVPPNTMQSGHGQAARVWFGDIERKGGWFVHNPRWIAKSKSVVTVLPSSPSLDPPSLLDYLVLLYLELWVHKAHVNGQAAYCGCNFTHDGF